MSNRSLYQKNHDVTAFAELPGATIQDKITSAVTSDEHKVVVFGRTNCPYAIEVRKSIADQQIQFVNYDIDLFAKGEFTQKKVHNALIDTTKQHTVPYVFANGAFLGGCDDTKALIASGDFPRVLESANNTAAQQKDLESGKSSMRSITLPTDRPIAPPTIKPLFFFPPGADNRIIRLVALQVFAIAVLLAVFAYQKKEAWHWVAVGLLADFVLRFLAGARYSPVGNIALLTAGLYDKVGPSLLGRPTGPIKTAGAPKQFAAFVGVIFSGAIVALQFTHQWQASTVIAGVLAFFAFLEWALNFCAGCYVFAYLVQFGIIGTK